MPSATESVVKRIQTLLADKLHHSSAIAKIDEVIGQIGAALRFETTGKKTKASTKKSAPASRQRKTFAMSGEQSILAFVKKAGHPSTKEIEKKWKSEGRKGSAANALGKLVREKKLKREAIKDGRGSRYSIA